VADLVNTRFVCVWKNIRPTDPMPDGMYNKTYTEQLTKLVNGTADVNISTAVGTPDGGVLHVVQGFWKAEDYVAELRFGLELADRRDRDALQKAHLARKEALGAREGAALLKRAHEILAKRDVTIEELAGAKTAGLR
jgi:hypothetical protein